jgi:hypothetical protein
MDLRVCERDRINMSNPFEHDRRKSMTPQQRARIFAANKGCCGWINAGKQEGCGRKLTAHDKWRVEHGNALENGGTDKDDNKGISCGWCWPAKDAEDHGKAAHNRKTYTKHVVPTADRKSSRGFKRPPAGFCTWTKTWRDQ